MAALALCLVVAAGVLWVRTTRDGPAGRPPDASAPPARSAPSSAVDVRARRAAVTLARLQDALQHGGRRQVTALAAGGAGAPQQELVTLWRNVRRLGIEGLSLRYLSDDTPRLTVGARRSVGPHRWVARVQVAWRLPPERRASSLQVPVVMRSGADPARFVTARPGSGRGADRVVPLWLLGPAWAGRSRHALVIAARRAQLPRFDQLAERAVAQVHRVLPRWDGRLVVEVPASEHQLTLSRGSEPGRYREIAAVTTTADGTVSRSAPVHVFVNPRVLGPLGPVGSQVVITHEATHVATGAAVSDLPAWLLEGFADYVALAHVDLPVTVTARQALTQVRRHGPPRHLPGASEFAADRPQLGASYESAWLACRLLAERYGESRLVAFYRRAERGGTAAAFRALGVSRAGFTRVWRAELRRLARVAAP